MKIVNPIYDYAFKYLMQNERMAKKVLSVILEMEILSVELGQKEYVVSDDRRGLTLYRLDFKAEVIDTDGKKQKILIELQKSKFDTDIQRFRTYLGTNYMERKSVIEEKAEKYHPALQIVTIYILGYNLPDIPFLAVTVNRQIINSVSKEELNIDSQFINLLTHRSHIIQVRRLPQNRQSRLEKFLTLFNQAWISDRDYILDLQEVPEEFRDLAQYLEAPLQNDDFRNKLIAEEELDEIFDLQERKYLKQIELVKTERENERKEKEKERAEKENALQKIAIAVQKMKARGFSVQEIAEDFGLEIEVINRMLSNMK